MAPASTSSVGAGLVGSTTARPGRITPGSDGPRGGPGRHHRLRLSPPDQLARDGRAGARASQAGQGALVHGEGVVRLHDLDVALVCGVFRRVSRTGLVPPG